MNTSATMRSDRIDIRTNPEVKAIIERAALLSHKSVSAYILDSAFQTAQEDIRETERLRLSVAEREVFYAALAKAPEPNDSLKALFTDSIEDREG
jgi:uncharacterized protein (DUF1778 family)